MKYLYLLLIALFTLPVFAQTKRVYLNINNQFTSTKDSAAYYLEIGKMNKDSLYAMSEFTVRDSILVSGTFKDSTLTFPQGKFVYYFTPAQIQPWKKAHITGTDTNKYIKNSGYYVNGIKTGLWSTYDYNGDLINSTTYKNDKMSGPYTFIDNGPTGLTAHVYEGTYVDGKKEGESKVTSIYGRLEETRFYHDDQLAKTIVNHKVTNGVIQPIAPVTFKAYLNKQIPKDAALGDKKIIIKLTVTKEGLVKDAVILSAYDDAEKNKSVMDLIKNSGKWKAGMIDGKHVDMVTFCTISMGKAGYVYVVPKY